MNLYGYTITIPLVFNIFIHAFGLWLLYINRKDLLYDNEDGDPTTPYTLSLGRCWSWMLFYLAFSFWLRYLTGEVPPTTPFPPGLQEMLYACMLYEFAKKGVDVSKIWAQGRRNNDNSSWGNSGSSWGNSGGNSWGNNSYPSSQYKTGNSYNQGNQGPYSQNTMNNQTSPSEEYTPSKAYGDDVDVPTERK